MTPSNDFALAIENGQIVAHRPDCPHVRYLADIGVPVLTAYGCENPLGDEYPRHDCLIEQSVET
jgi:hypothetical protein